MFSRTAASALVLATLMVATTGCGPDCQSTCDKIYGEAPGCGDPTGEHGTESYYPGTIGPSGTREKLLGQCMDECSNALQTPGEVGNYTPQQYTPSDEVVELENDKQVALWMECVDGQSCENLTSGYCAPIW